MKLFDLFEAPREYIAKSQGAKLVDRALEDVGEELSLDEILDQLMNADPTGRQKYLQWIVNRYLAKEFKLEDVNRVKDDLGTFERIKRTLDKKDINQYKTLTDLYAVTDAKPDDDELLSNKQKKKSEYQEKRDEFIKTNQAEIIYKGPDGMLVIPKTKEASQFFGQGTKWCTAALKHNMFDEYNNHGPLYIWLGKDGTKEQYSIDEVQFMDAQDKALPKERTIEILNKKPLSDIVTMKINQAIKDDNMRKFTDLVDVSGRDTDEYRDIIKTKIKQAMENGNMIKLTDLVTMTKGDQTEYSDYYLRDPIYSSFVASHAMNKRWTEFEKVALTNPLSTSPLDVATYVRKMKISNDFVNKYLEAFKSNPVLLANFSRRANRVLPKYEPYILRNPRFALLYADLMKRTPWPELEKAILDNPRNISPSIIPDSKWTSDDNGPNTRSQFHKIGDPMPDYSYDKSKHSNVCLNDIVRYVAEVRNKSWPEYENLIKGTPLEKPYRDELSKWENGFYRG